jgi:eukaryotic-like serine/threonine-protein kinase
MTAERWRRIETLYHAAAATPPEERAAYLVNACGADDDLRCEVAALLAQGEGSDAGFLETPAAAVGSTLGRGRTAGHASLVGQRLGRYEIVHALGVGGMGEVYRAHDTTLGRDVAIKILPSHFTSDRDRLARFEREARVLASLNHPNIGAIYGLEDADGVRALVLELVQGDTLNDRIAHGRLPIDDTLTIARQIAQALEAAHEKGVVHRDLKPANS